MVALIIVTPSQTTEGIPKREIKRCDIKHQLILEV